MSNFTALIPLDTTPFSETSLLVLPMLKSIGFDRARLIAVYDGKKRGSKDQSPEALQAYLDEQAARVEQLGLTAETRVEKGDAADVCIAAAAEDDVDLILIATHGRSGIARLRLGSVGEKLIKNASCPRLVVGPNVDIDMTSYALTRILVPLDGSEMSEMSLPIARHLAKLTGAQVDLLRSVSATVAVGEPMMAGVDVLSTMLEEAENYLSRVAATFTTPVTRSVITGRPDEAILGHLKENPVDLVVMVSRGRTGLARVAMGSVAERVLQGPDPVLIFEPGEDRSRLFRDAREGTQV